VFLADLLVDRSADAGAIAGYLDGLDSPARWAQLRRLGRAQQRVLYDAAGGGKIDLEHFVGGVDPGVEVVHDGRNTLPLPPPLSLFQKRFCRMEEGASQVAGFNDGSTRWLLGPGYFVAGPDADGVVFDYTRVPATVPSGWPPVVPNSQGLQRFVFAGTRDVVRRVSMHACIGAVFKDGHPLDHYFVLCRRP
jgi:hypothetical protein